MRLGILTSSRADFGIYLPLLKELNNDSFFDISLIVFGSHLSKNHGYTIQEIYQNGFKPRYILETIFYDDSPLGIAQSITNTFKHFDKFWGQYYKTFDLILCLGDRYEMYAAVSSGIPFGIKYAHLHGGETTLGSIDNIYRHSITLASKIHFTATSHFKKRVKSLLGVAENIFIIGSLSLDGVMNTNNLSISEFSHKWNMDLRIPTILVTVHSETVAFVDVQHHCDELLKTLLELAKKYQILITMPNADTNSSVVRNMIETNLRHKNNFFIYENLGKQSYFTAMNYCSFLLGNTSSGIIEAASFKKFVIDLGERQKGRLSSKNILHSNYKFDEILSCVKQIELNNYEFKGKNIYYKKNVAIKIINILKSIR